jgi:hypothetical protein
VGAAARYDVEVQHLINQRVCEVLDEATFRREPEERAVNVTSGVVRDAILSKALESNLPDPRRVQGTKFSFPDETYQATRKAFGLAERSP